MEEIKTVANTVYKLWLGQSSLGKSGGFSKASFYHERSVPKYATAHIHKRYASIKKQNDENSIHLIDNFFRFQLHIKVKRN